jgi:hypothetical protein
MIFGVMIDQAWFPTLFIIARHKDARMANNFQSNDGFIEWKVLFMRQVQNWEMELVLAFFERLYSFKICHGEGDRVRWSPSKRCQFKVKPFHKVLYSQAHLASPWKNIW